MSGRPSGFFRRLAGVLVAGVAAVVLACPAGAAPGQDAGRHLKPVHTYELLDELAANHGKVILVNFFAAFCGPCRREIPELMKMRKEIPEEDLLIIGIAIDENIREADSFVKSMGMLGAYPVYYGGEELARAYRIDAIPFNVIYNRDGHIEVSEAGYVPAPEMKQFLMSLIRR
ncbi:TlpA disulfide reductase family protein [uncultured Mailhella sp.]|uniref:TlpA family protein disulfide reductase n=1 Tax=uncultured Mailhella sp. TaxID=1981031 RepID=UPI0025DF91CF|nr:TlpA disulfide reductase family protein [uncultured Mailhella sp.]